MLQNEDAILSLPSQPWSPLHVFLFLFSVQNIAPSNATGCPWWQSKSIFALRLSYTLSALRESSFLCSISACLHFNPCLWDDHLIMQNINLRTNAWLASIRENKTFIWGGKSCSSPLVESSRENYKTLWCFVSWRFHWIDLSDGALVILKATCCRLHLCRCKGEVLRKYKADRFSPIVSSCSLLPFMCLGSNFGNYWSF